MENNKVGSKTEFIMDHGLTIYQSCLVSDIH